MTIAEWVALGALALGAIAGMSTLVKVLLDRRPNATTAAATVESLSVQSSETAVKTVSDVLAIVKQARIEENLEHAQERAEAENRYVLLESRVLALESDKAALSSRLEQREAESAAMAQENVALRTEVDALRAEVRNLEVERDHVRAELAALQALTGL